MTDKTGNSTYLRGYGMILNVLRNLCCLPVRHFNIRLNVRRPQILSVASQFWLVVAAFLNNYVR